MGSFTIKCWPLTVTIQQFIEPWRARIKHIPSGESVQLSGRAALPIPLCDGDFRPLLGIITNPEDPEMVTRLARWRSTIATRDNGAVADPAAHIGKSVGTPNLKSHFDI